VADTDAETMSQEEKRVGRPTLETGLWILVGLVALSLRLAQLDGAPLTASEAEAALQAWRGANGGALPVGDYNPFLLAANSLVFVLFVASDGLARLWPVLFGTVLALTPALLKRALGRAGALTAGIYLALSPTALVASRQLDGTVIGAAGAMVCVGAAVRWVETRRRGWLPWSAIGLALGLSGGASFYGVVLPLVVALIAVSRLRLEGGIGFLLQAVREAAVDGSRFVLVLLGALLAFSTGLGWNLTGLGAVGGHLAVWFARFGAGGPAAASPLLLLVVYELFGLAFALAGLVWGLVEGREEPVVLGLWAGAAALMLGVMPGRAPTDLLWVVVPLALLTGAAIEALLEGARAQEAGGSGRLGLQVAYGGLMVVLWAHGCLMLAQYSHRGDEANLALALIAVVVQAPLALSAGLLLGAERTLRTTVAGTGLVLLVFTLSAGWGVAYGHPADPREPLLDEPTADNVRDLVMTLEDLSWEETGVRTELPMVYEAREHSVLAWYLRDFGDAERVTQLADVQPEELGGVVVSEGRDETVLGTADEPYVGQDFSVSRRWSPRSLGCRLWDTGCTEAVEWFLFRSGVDLPAAETWVTLWRASEDSVRQ